MEHGNEAGSKQIPSFKVRNTAEHWQQAKKNAIWSIEDCSHDEKALQLVSVNIKAKALPFDADVGRLFQLGRIPCASLHPWNFLFLFERKPVLVVCSQRDVLRHAAFQSQGQRQNGPKQRNGSLPHRYTWLPQRHRLPIQKHASPPTWLFLCGSPWKRIIINGFWWGAQERSVFFFSLVSGLSSHRHCPSYMHSFSVTFLSSALVLFILLQINTLIYTYSLSLSLCLFKIDNISFNF